jgi:sugar lactone lactonase YvrE
MRKTAICVTVAIAMNCVGFYSIACAELAPGEIRTLVVLPADESPEGIAVNRADGALFIGIRRTNGDLLTNELLRIDAAGHAAPYATLPQTPVDPTGAGSSGVQGLAIDLDGIVFAALLSMDANTRGVYKISNGGAEVQRIAGSGSILYPNALAFDNQRNLYVTDSLGGAVWRFDPDDVNQTGELWFQHELLKPLPTDPLGTPLIGANGIAYFPDRLYVANTERGLIATIPIHPDGTAGSAATVAGGSPIGQLITVDGIATDAQGNIHAVIPTYEAAALRVPPLLQPSGGYAPIVRVDPDTGVVMATAGEEPTNPRFDVPLSLAFGTLGDDRATVFITNGSLPAAQGIAGPGPRILQVGIGVRGFVTVPEPRSDCLVTAIVVGVSLGRSKRRA